MNAEPIIPNADRELAALLASGERERALIGILYRSHPHSVRAAILMEMLGIKFSTAHGYVKPPSAYVEFANILARSRAALNKYGLTLRHDGGRYVDSIWISEQVGSPG